MTTNASARNAPAARNVAFPGTITLHVDATDLAHGVFTMHAVIPVKSGPLTLFYPQWIPGHHSPTGPIEALSGLVIRAHGAADRRITWTRDPDDVYAFKITVPGGVTSIDLDYQFTPVPGDDDSPSLMTEEILGVEWHRHVMYPAGYYVSRIPVTANLTIPAGWQIATALDVASQDGATTHFKTTSLETLVDSPLYAGKYVKRIELNPGERRPVRLNVIADSSEELTISDAQLDAHKRLVREITTLFGSQHYDHYDFLLAISESFSRSGLEHHRSSNNSVDRGYFKEWDKQAPGRYLLPHEMVHSWDGKFRRPADLWTPDFNTPMQDTLLWVYEGMTEYYGQVLAARSGLWPQEYARAAMAAHAANLQERRPGREWRNLDDTNNQPIITPRRPLAYTSWQRTEDYYREGALIWMEVDARIRELTSNKRSLDDFAHAFFGVQDGSYAPLTYTFDDIVKSLNSIARFDWATYLRDRLTSNTSRVTSDAFERAGWKIVFKPEPSDFTKQLDVLNESTDLGYSLGLYLGKAGKIEDATWGGPAFKAGLAPGMKLVAVNGRAYKADTLKDLVKGGKPLELLIKSREDYRTVPLQYTGGLRYPHLERIDGKTDRLTEILKPRVPPG